jgi:hypothetical protein
MADALVPLYRCSLFVSVGIGRSTCRDVERLGGDWVEIGEKKRVKRQGDRPPQSNALNISMNRNIGKKYRET